MGNSFADILALADLITAGLKSNMDKVAKRGMDNAFITEMENLSKKATELNAEQEALKARLKDKTAEIDKVVKDIKSHISESKKVIKLAIDKTSWKQFGIS